MGEISTTLTGGKADQVTVTTAVTEIVPASNSRRAGVLIYNNSSETIYIDIGDTVDTSTGFPLTMGSVLKLGTKSKIVAVTASGTADVRVLEL